MDVETFLVIIFILVGMIEIIIAFPLFMGKVKKNIYYGFRLPKTLSNDKIWHKANKYTGRDLIFAGIFVVISSLILSFFRYDLSISNITIISTIVLLGSLFIVIIRGVLYLKEL